MSVENIENERRIKMTGVSEIDVKKQDDNTGLRILDGGFGICGLWFVVCGLWFVVLHPTFNN